MRNGCWLLVNEKRKRPTFKAVWSKWCGHDVSSRQWFFENNVFLFLEKLFVEHRGVCFHLNGPTIMSSSPQEEPCYSQLKAGRDPCSCNCQIPLRRSLNPPALQQHTQTQTHTSELKHVLLSLTPGSTNMLCVMLHLHKSAPVKQQSLQTLSTPCHV